MRGTGKAYRTHVHHWSTPYPRPWSFPVRRWLFKQPGEQTCCCSLIYKLPILRMVGASARYSCLHTPVETGTPPCVEMDSISLASPKRGESSSIPSFRLVSSAVLFYWQFALANCNCGQKDSVRFGCVEDPKNEGVYPRLCVAEVETE